MAQEIVQLPKPDLSSAVTFSEVINHARTNATYLTRPPVSAADLSCILWIAGGRRFNVDGVSGASRAYPSTFSWYPIDLFVVVANVDGIKAGIYQYLPREHGLKLLVGGDHRQEAVDGVPFSYGVTAASATVVLAVDMTQYKDRYQGHPWLSMELGFLAETISLTAASRGHAISIVSEVDPQKEKALFETQEDPLLFLPVGN